LKRIYSFFATIATDIIFAALSFYFALMLRFEGVIPAAQANNTAVLPVIIIQFIALSAILGCYNGAWEFTGLYELLRQFSATFLSCSVLFIMKMVDFLQISYSIIILYGIILFILTSINRVLPRVIQRFKSTLSIHIHKKNAKRALIVGAGVNGAQMIRRLSDNNKDLIYPVVCIDDDPNKKDLKICGIRVVGTTDDIKKVVWNYRINEIIIAISPKDTPAIREVYNKALAAGVPVKLVQNVIDVEKYLQYRKPILKEVSIEDLLFRDSVNTDDEEAQKYINGKVVLVTGGAGSIGSELCRQVLKNHCSKLIIFDFCENGLFEINEELKQNYSQLRYELVLGSIQDKARIAEVFAKYNPQIVFHAAAHKHVPMVEINPFEAVKNNIIGTKNVIDACKKYNVKKFILISTDKAVNPTSVMGASKRIAELIVKAENCAQTEMASVRFGNVLGSQGSVVPLFKKQIEAGGPITITDPEMKRYFMTIPEAVSLVQTAAALANGGETFVLDMGKPIKIYDLACDLIRLSGLEPNKDINIIFTGLRPGEKMFEELSLDNETVDTTSHSKIYVMRSCEVNHINLYKDIYKIINYTKQGTDENELRRLIFDIIEKEEEYLKLSKIDMTNKMASNTSYR